MTETIEDMLLRHEGLKLKPYHCSAGKLTIGVGRNLDDRGITKEEAFLMLANDINDCIEDLNTNLSWWNTLSEKRQYVLIDMCFNLGIGGLMGFRNTLKFIKEGKYKEASRAMLQSKWATQVGERATELSGMMEEG